jgi:hypothetical protein
MAMPLLRDRAEQFPIGGGKGTRRAPPAATPEHAGRAAWIGAPASAPALVSGTPIQKDSRAGLSDALAW